MYHLSPHFLTKHFRQILGVLSVFFVMTFIYSIFLIYHAPEDYLQGVHAKIMYVHVPSAWLSLMLYTTMALFSIGYTVFKNPFYFSIAKSIAPIGCGFALITLVTGSIWGKPTWGTWWVWDARLTSMLILFFVYIGYIGLSKSFEDERKVATICSVFAIIGLLNIPIIKFSVDIWNTLHQPASVFRFDGSTIHNSMLIPLMVFAISMLVLSCIVILLRVQGEVCKKRFNRLQHLLNNEILS